MRVVWGKFDLDAVVSRFVTQVDEETGVVDWDVEKVLLAMGRNMDLAELTDHVKHYVLPNPKAPDAAEIAVTIADLAMSVLYKGIRSKVYEVGWIEPYVHQAKVSYTRRNHIQCTALIRAGEKL